MDPSGDAILERLVSQAAEAADAGVDWIQVRERDLGARVLSDLVDRVVAVVRERAKVIVNDRLDVAIGSGAGGGTLRDVLINEVPRVLRTDISMRPRRRRRR